MIILRYRWAASHCLLATLLMTEPSAANAGSTNSSNPLAAQSLELLSATLTRPLFQSGRRAPSSQPPPASVEKPQPPSPPPTVVLLGIIKENHEIRAMLRTGTANKVLSVRTGDDVGGWKIAEIEPRRVTLSFDERTTSIKLFENKGPKPPAGNGRNSRSQVHEEIDTGGD